MDILSIVLDFTIKDWLILITLIILVFCILEIYRLRKSIAQEIHRRLTPQLTFYIDTDAMAVFIKNESYFLARDIKIEETNVIIEDYGFKKRITLRFEPVDSLRPQEEAPLKLKTFDKQQELPENVTKTMVTHLASASFRLKVNYSNIENLMFNALIIKKGKKFYTKEINPSTQNVPL